MQHILTARSFCYARIAEALLDPVYDLEAMRPIVLLDAMMFVFGAMGNRAVLNTLF